MRTVARSSISAHGQGGIFLWDAVSENIPSSVFVLHGHRLCRDIAGVLILPLLRSGYLIFIVFLW